MAIHLPTQLNDSTRPRRFIRGNPVISGDAAGDLKFGTRSLSSSQNHVHAYRVRSLGGLWDPDDAVIFSNGASAGWQDFTEEIDIPIAADVADITIDAWIIYGQVRIWVDDGTGPYMSAASAAAGAALTQVSSTLTLYSSAGITFTVKLQYDRTDGQTFDLHGFEGYEVEMLAGDFPA